MHRVQTLCQDIAIDKVDQLDHVGLEPVMKFHAPIAGDRPLDLPLVFAHFLPWFTLRGGDFPLPAAEAATLDVLPTLEDFRHWNDSRAGYRRTHHHLPAIGTYDSRSPAVIEWQIGSAQQHGVAGFILNWYGKNSAENVITLHWLRGLENWNRPHPDRPFLYFISFDSQAQRATEGRLPVTMEEDFCYIRDHLLRDAYLRRDGRPVFSVFPYEENAPAWRAALDAAFGAGGADLIWMNGFPGAGENGAYPWVRPDDQALDYANLYPWADPNNAGDRWLRSFYRAASERNATYAMGGVWPGFNDHLVSWAWNPRGDEANLRPRVITRETTRGNTLDLTWRAYLDYLRDWAAGHPEARTPAPLLQLVTWNDYAETTTVEPTRDYGTAPLEMCQRHLAEARRVWSSRPLPTDH